MHILDFASGGSRMYNKQVNPTLKSFTLLYFHSDDPTFTLKAADGVHLDWSDVTCVLAT